MSDTLVLQELHETVSRLEDRIRDLENKEPVPGPVGPQGKPGNISAAIENAEKAAREIVREADVRNQKRIAELTEQVREFQQIVLDQEARFEKAVQTLARDFREGLDNNVAASILGLLQEYHVLDDQNQPSAKYFMYEIRRELQP